MFSKLFNKLHHHQEQGCSQDTATSTEVSPRVALHYGVPATASVLAFDHVQRLLAVGTQDGRIKVIGGNNIEGLLISPKQSPINTLEFLQNQGFLASVSKDNEIQVWDLEQREIATTLRWESTITSFSIIYATPYMYVGSEYGTVSVLKFDSKERKIVFMPYYVPTDVISGTIGMLSLDHVSVVGVLPQPCSQGNRLLIAYENGLLVLWDAYEDQIILIRGHKDLEVKDNNMCLPKNKTAEPCGDIEEVEKEISSLCWASEDGSILAVGYVDGDMLLWDLSSDAAYKDQPKENWSNHIFKLELSSGERRMPITVMHWSANRPNNGRGQLFIYGGDEVGSEEFLTILTLDWPSGIKSLNCTSRIKFKLNGAFSDMVLLSNDGSTKGNSTMFFVLTNPGELKLYDNACLSSLMDKQEKMISAGGIPYQIVVPTLEPHVKTAKLSMVHRNVKSSKILSEMALAAKLNHGQTQTSQGTKWPLASGLDSQLLKTEEYHINQLYMAGYEDGSLRVWDATYPALSLSYILGLEVNDSDIAGVNTSVSAIEFCSDSLQFAIGKECGLVQLYDLTRPSEEKSLHLVTKTKTEVKSINQGNGPSCKAVFSLLKSRVCILKFVRFGVKLAAGYECGRVAMLDAVTLSVLFLTESIPNSSSAVISIDMKFSETCSSLNCSEVSESENFKSPGQGLHFIMTRDARIFVVDDVSGKVITNATVILKKETTVISICLIEEDDRTCGLSKKLSTETSQIKEPKGEHAVNVSGVTSAGVGNINSIDSSYVSQTISKLLVVVCCENELSIYPLKSLIEGCCQSIWNMNLVDQCIWTTIFKEDEKECSLVVLYQTGTIEIRTLPTLELVGKSSLASRLRWNLDTNMKETICSSGYGQIVLINENEIVFLSLMAYKNEYRIPESLPCLHDKVLAATADTSIRLPSTEEERNRGSASGFWTDIMKNLKPNSVKQKAPQVEVIVYHLENLERLFSSPPFLKPWMDKEDDLGFDIDDIQIDEPLTVISTNVEKKGTGIENKEKGTARERLFEGSSTDTQPKARTVEEIKAKYGKPGTGDVAAVAKETRNKLLERQEKLQKLSDHTEELKDEAEDFASVAGELAKRMQNRKWWQL